MYEEFLKQAREFGQSVWGGLFRFLVGAVFVANVFIQPIQKWRLWFAILSILLAVGWAVYLLLYRHLLLGGLLTFIVLLGIVRIIAVETQRRRHKV